MTLPAWCVVGAEVAVTTAFTNYTKKKIARFTATQIVLDDDSRFSKNNYSEHGSYFYGNQHGTRVTMMAGDDSRAVRAEITQIVGALRFRLDGDLGYRGRVIRSIPQAEEHVETLRKAVAMANDAYTKALQLYGILEDRGEIRARD